MRNGAVNISDTLQGKMQGPKSLREKLTSWESKSDPKAPLSFQQKDSFMELTTLSATRLIPNELPLDEAQSLLPSLPRMDSHSDLEALITTEMPDGRISNSQQFFWWFGAVEDKMEAELSAPHRQLVKELQLCRAECESVLDETAHSLRHLEDLKVNYVRVATKTNALHEACETLLEEQTRLVDTADSIHSKLAYFNELNNISSKLGSPTLTVTNESFVPMLSRMDECIAYINQNRQYKEADVFLARFRQCLSRALGLIRTHVIHILQTATQQVLPKKPEKVYNVDNKNSDFPTPTDDAFTLFYGKFRTNAPRVKSLLEQVEIRLDKSPEYTSLLGDCHNCYFTQRVTLLGPSVAIAVTELARKHTRDHCALVRSGCAFMLHICEDEHQLFQHFFSRPTPLLHAMLEQLCNNLYDVLRPLIIHVNHLETLAELCSILHVEMLDEHVVPNAEALTAFEAICMQMLEDVQERLVYRTHIYIRQEILNYRPASGDLAYPAKLEMMESIAASMKEQRLKRSESISSSTSATSLEVEHINTQNDGITSRYHNMDTFVTVPLTVDTGGGTLGSSNMPMSPADLHGMWYPTVRRTLVCLSKLYRCIDRSTFQGLSQETLSMCIQSLINAADQITAKASSMDGELFLIKHLLILREQIAPFHVDFAIRETSLDFSKIKDAAVDLLKAKAKLFSLNSTNAVLQFIVEGTPQVHETFLDSKKEVDYQLKLTCEEFIHNSTAQFVGPLTDFLTKAATIIAMREDSNAPQVALCSQPFASPEKLQETVAVTYRNLKQYKASTQRAMALYLANKDTEYILFKPIKSNIQSSFQQLYQILSEHYTAEDQQIVSPPSLEQINLLLSSQPPKVSVTLPNPPEVPVTEPNDVSETPSPSSPSQPEIINLQST